MTATPTDKAPKLRFTEFHGDWQRKPLSEVVSLVSGYAFKSEHFGKKGVKLITPKNFTKNGSPSFTEGNTKWTTEKPPEKFVCAADDLLLLLTDLTPTCELLGKPAVLSEDDAPCLLNQRIAKVEVLNGEVESSFLANLFLSSSFTRRIKETASGSTVRHSSNKIVLGFVGGFPTLPEQRKIADFLTAVDGRIGQLIQKKALLEDYKEGVMQQLFTQAIRFKDKVNGEAREGALGCDHGNDFPDWEEKRVGEFAPLQRGFDLVTTAVREGNIPVVYSNGILRTHNESKAKGPGVVTGRSGTIGKVTFVEEDYWPHNTSLWVTEFYENDPKFVYFFYLNLGLEHFKAGGAVPTLNRNDVHSKKVYVPSPNEQNKIADFLSALDRKIESVATQITETQTFKRGLLQQMFV